MFLLSEENIEYKYYNERDIEIPILLGSILENSNNIKSLLDIGACYSYFHYAGNLREILKDKIYDGVDIQDCSKTRALLDNYYLGNVLTKNLKKYDAVISISTIEHAGLNPYHIDNYEAEQNIVFANILLHSESYILVTCPFGAKGIYPNEYSNITSQQLAHWESICGVEKFKADKQFWFNEFPQGKQKWYRILEKDAIQVPLLPDKGAQCILFLEAKKLER